MKIKLAIAALGILVIVSSGVSSLFAANSVLEDAGITAEDSERVILSKLYQEISIPPKWLDTIGGYEYRTVHSILPLPPVITYKTRTGDCDDLALLMFTAGVIAGVDGMSLTFGTINGHGHGWIEHEDYVYDLSYGRVITIDELDALGYVRIAGLR
ncbi:MAG: hypothetical protein P3T54_00110 [Dehalogenimonas sp.]|nr:hypothetical protein [Dehalogenimonas sp.]